jgi:collagenase-like protein with putative collagen-binding domain
MPPLPLCRLARAETPRRPAYLLETTYENEHNAPVSDIRAQQYWGLVGCGAGEFSGNNPIWLFGPGWPQQLDSPLSLSQVRLEAIATGVRWQDLALDAAFVTAGKGIGGSEVAAARTADGAQALLYVPPSGAASITVDLSRMAGPVTATWLDPTTAAMQAAGTGLTGSHAFARPAANAAGDGDWVLALTSP